MDPSAIDNLVPIIAIAGALAYAGLRTYFRHRATEMRHKERIAAIEKGAEIPLEPESGSNFYLLQGLKALFIGIGISVLLIAMGLEGGNRKLFAVATVGLMPAGIGIANLVLYRIQNKSERTATGGATASDLR